MSLSVLPITTYDHWWNAQIPGHVRKNVRKAQKKGVICRIAAFDDELARGITRIYNEAPTRQGKALWHYGKDFETVKAEASTYLASSEYIGAYLDEELIEFIKFVYMDRCASTMHVISMISHRDKAPTNALVAKAVEVCASKSIPFLQYGEWISGSLGDFKRYSGFEKMDVPRYNIALTPLGAAAIRANLHHGWRAAIPASVRKRLGTWRRKVNAARERGAESAD